MSNGLEPLEKYQGRDYKLTAPGVPEEWDLNNEGLMRPCARALVGVPKTCAVFRGQRLSHHQSRIRAVQAHHTAANTHPENAAVWAHDPLDPLLA